MKFTAKPFSDGKTARKAAWMKSIGENNPSLGVVAQSNLRWIPTF